MKTDVIKEPALSEDYLHETAITKTGFTNFGDPIYRQGLRALLEAYKADHRSAQVGYQHASRTIVDYLAGRLYAQHGWIKHPNVLSNQIRHPLIIIGLARTGTTALHRLLAIDPQFQGLEPWLSGRPMIRPPRETWENHAEYCDCVERLAALYTQVPSFSAVHHCSAIEVDECGRVLNQSFLYWGLGVLLPSYVEWLRTQDVKPSYRYYADVLRLIGAREPYRRWLLKDPFHMLELSSLLDVFPDACIIQTHRDPIEAIPSWYSLYKTAFQGAGILPVGSLGKQLCSYWRDALDRTHIVRQKSPSQFFDVDYRLFIESPLYVVHSIYERFALTLSPHIEQKMLGWIAASHTSRHSKHRYILDSIDVTHDQICKAFGDYRSQHGFS